MFYGFHSLHWFCGYCARNVHAATAWLARGPSMRCFFQPDWHDNSPDVNRSESDIGTKTGTGVCKKKAPWTFRCRPRSPHFNVEGSSWRRSFFVHSQFVLNVEVWGAGSDFECQGAFFSQTPVSILHCQFKVHPPRINEWRCLFATSKKHPQGGGLRGGSAPTQSPAAGGFCFSLQTISETHVPSTIATKLMKTMKTMKTIPENHSYLHENHENHNFF